VSITGTDLQGHALSQSGAMLQLPAVEQTAFLALLADELVERRLLEAEFGKASDELRHLARRGNRLDTMRKLAEMDGTPYVDIPGCPRPTPPSIPSFNLLTSNGPLKDTYYDVINADEVEPGAPGYTFFILDKNGFALDEDSLNHYLRDNTNVFYKCKSGTPLTSLRIRQGDVHMETPLRVLNFDTRIYVMDSMAQLIQHGHTYILKPTEERIGQIASRDVVNGGSVVGGDHCQENKTERIYAIEEVAVGHPVGNVGNTGNLLNMRAEPVEPRKPATAIPNSLLRNAALSNVLDEAYNEYVRNQSRGGARRTRRGTKKRSTRRRRSRRI
jgi:hypothetical protein